MDKLLTQKDLAERWQVSEKTIETYRKEGVITPVSFIKHPRFEPSYIKNMELEGMKLERFSPLERRKLERELEEWKLRAEKAECALAKVNMVITEAVYLKNKGIGINIKSVQG